MEFLRRSLVIEALSSHQNLWIHLILTTTELSTKRLINIYLKQIWKLHGITKKITSNRGPQFASELMKELCIQLGIQQNLSTAYHPQTDGQVKCSHQEMETFLHHYVNHLQDNWEDWLAIAKYQYNNKIHSSTVLQCLVTILPTVCHSMSSLFFLSFPLDYIIDPRMA